MAILKRNKVVHSSNMYRLLDLYTVTKCSNISFMSSKDVCWQSLYLPIIFLLKLPYRSTGMFPPITLSTVTLFQYAAQLVDKARLWSYESYGQSQIGWRLVTERLFRICYRLELRLKTLGKVYCNAYTDCKHLTMFSAELYFILFSFVSAIDSFTRHVTWPWLAEPLVLVSLCYRTVNHYDVT